jgi:Zn-dependent peptidase ImmA (M78 family)
VKDYDPYQHAEQLGITVLHRPIRSAQELWLPDHNTIVIRSGLRRIHDRSVLAHGIAHAALGHEDDRPKHEAQADRYASEKLIDRGELDKLMPWVEDPNRLALELGVTHRILQCYLDTHGLAS